MPVIKVTDADDPRLAPFLSIREKDLTRAHGGRFMVEGKVTLETLIRRSFYPPESVFLSESRVEPLAPLLAELDPDVPVYVAPQTVMDEVAGFPLHRGVLACARKGPAREVETLLDGSRTVLVLIGLSNHDNVGACFRNAAAFGVDAVLLDETSCDPLYRKSIRVSAGTALTLPFAQGKTGETLMTWLKDAGFGIWCLTPAASSVPITGLKRSNRLAIVLGAEGPGLPPDIIQRGRAVRIPMVKGMDSVNVATAGAIALSHVFTAQEDVST